MAPALPVRADVEQVYGIANVSQWADLDNDGDATKITNRINWAISRGYDYILGRLSKRFDISTFVNYPSVIFQLIAKRAGIELYTSPRGIVDGDAATAQLNAMSLQIEAQLDQILSGQLQLLDAPALPSDGPGVYNSCNPFASINRRYGYGDQWTGEPICIPYGNFFAGN